MILHVIGNMLLKNKTFAIHHQNIQSLGVEIYRKSYRVFSEEPTIATTFALDQNCCYQMSVIFLRNSIHIELSKEVLFSFLDPK